MVRMLLFLLTLKKDLEMPSSQLGISRLAAQHSRARCLMLTVAMTCLHYYPDCTYISNSEHRGDRPVLAAEPLFEGGGVVGNSCTKNGSTYCTALCIIVCPT